MPGGACLMATVASPPRHTRQPSYLERTSSSDGRQIFLKRTFNATTFLSLYWSSLWSSAHVRLFPWLQRFGVFCVMAWVTCHILRSRTVFSLFAFIKGNQKKTSEHFDPGSHFCWYRSASYFCWCFSERHIGPTWKTRNVLIISAILKTQKNESCQFLDGPLTRQIGTRKGWKFSRESSPKQCRIDRPHSPKAFVVLGRNQKGETGGLVSGHRVSLEDAEAAVFLESTHTSKFIPDIELCKLFCFGFTATGKFKNWKMLFFPSIKNLSKLTDTPTLQLWFSSLIQLFFAFSNSSKVGLRCSHLLSINSWLSDSKFRKKLSQKGRRTLLTSNEERLLWKT